MQIYVITEVIMTKFAVIFTINMVILVESQVNSYIIKHFYEDLFFQIILSHRDYVRDGVCQGFRQYFCNVPSKKIPPGYTIHSSSDVPN
jgi:hypothetical protein